MFSVRDNDSFIAPPESMIRTVSIATVSITTVCYTEITDLRMVSLLSLSHERECCRTEYQHGCDTVAGTRPQTAGVRLVL